MDGLLDVVWAANVDQLSVGEAREEHLQAINISLEGL
jgi:hypothetical protein